MLAAFTKPIQLVDAADIVEVTAQTWPESYTVEYKRTLSHRSGRSHPWLTGKDEIGDHARDEIMAEIVAFANAQGGSLILGIDETPEKPPRARAVVSRPRVGELARRFEDQARSCIDPPLSRLEIQPVVVDGRDDGVVVFRIAASRAAPHRLTTTRESFVRRGSSTVKMTMREIQDMTLNVARGLAGIDASFKQQRDAFHEWASDKVDFVVWRVTAIPLVELPDPGRLFGRQNDFFLSSRSFNATVGDRTFDMELPMHMAGGRPRLRRIVRSAKLNGANSQWELHQSGLTDLWIMCERHPNYGRVLFHGEILGALCNVLTVLNHYRDQVGAPGAEYGIEVEISEGTASSPALYFGLHFQGGADRYPIPDSPILIPRLSVGASGEFEDIVNAVNVDIYDSLGVGRASHAHMRIDFPA